MSQVFLKELVFRAVQIATEGRPVDEQQVALVNEDFESALNERIAGGGRHGKRIVGFHVEAS